jgi:hypothetical protein
MFFGLTLVAALTGFCALDSALTRLGLEGVYYAVHSVHNAAIAYSTFPEVVATLTQFTTAIHAPVNLFALEICAALHLYHIMYYYKKFRFDDWLHHALMIGIALPIGGIVSSGTMLGFSLFFTTGLPGCISYALLVMSRNFWIRRDIEKRINTWVNVWVRSPGCAAQAALSVVALNTHTVGGLTTAEWYAGLLAGLLNYWNGQYFMQQVVLDWGKRYAAEAAVPVYRLFPILHTP